MTAEEIVNAAKRMWAQAGAAEISDENAWGLARDAVRFVEAVDYPTNITTVSGSGYTFGFSATPSAISEQLYIYKAVDLFESSSSGKGLLDGSIGVTFKRGPDSIATEGQGRARADMLAKWRKEYRRMLFRALGSANASAGGNTGDVYIITSDELTEVN